MTERVSIIIPTYNRAQLVKEAIESALAQTYRACDIYVLDDGSTDETPALAQTFGDKIHYIRQENAGVEAARNRGADESSGAYLYFVDSDDLLHPDAVATLVALAQSAPDVGLAYGQAREVDFQGHDLRVYRPEYAHPGGTWPGISELEHLLIKNYIHPGACLLRRSVWDASGGFDPWCAGVFEDWDLWTRIARQGQIGYAPAVILTVRAQAGGLSQHFGPENYLRTKRHMIDAAFAEAETRSRLAPARARIEGAYWFDVAWMAYSVHDVKRARSALREALAIYPDLLGDPEIPDALWLRFRLRLPTMVTELARAFKHHTSER